MSTINLKNLVSKKDVAALLNEIINLGDDVVTVTDVNGNVLLQSKSCDNFDSKLSIRLGGEPVGWVKGGKAVPAVASMLTRLINNELEITAIAKETLYRYKELNLLHHTVDKITSNLVLNEVCSMVIEEAKKLIAADNVSVMLLNGDGCFDVIAASGVENKEKLKLRPGVGLAGSIFLKGKTEIINDVSKDERFIRGSNNINSMMCAPIKIENRVIGVINLSCKKLFFYKSDQLRLFDTLALHGSVAIANARYYEEIKKHRDHLEVMVAERTNELKESNEALKKSEMARESFFHMIVHDLKSPLSNLLNAVELSEDDNFSDDKEFTKKLNLNMRKTIVSMLSLIEGILDLSRLEANEIVAALKPINAFTFVKEFCGQYDCRAGALNKGILFDCKSENIEVMADNKLLSRVMQNIIDNALKNAPKNTNINLRIDKNDNDVIISIHNSGPVIPDEYKKRIFEKYFQIGENKFKRSGTGIGLAFCKLATEAMGGKIWVEDGENCGANFKVLLSANKECFSEQALSNNK